MEELKKMYDENKPLFYCALAMAMFTAFCQVINEVENQKNKLIENVKECDKNDN